MDKLLKLEKYLNEFFSTRYSDYKMFYQDEFDHRREGIYKLKGGSELLDLLRDIVANIENKFYVKQLVPQVFTTPEKFIEHLQWFKEHLNKQQQLLDNNKNDNTDNV